MIEPIISDERLAFELRKGQEDYIPELVSRYLGIVSKIAENLTNRANLVDEIVEDVFVRIYFDIKRYPERDLESLVHEFTYDAALSRLIGSVDLHLANTHEFAVRDTIKIVSDDIKAVKALEDFGGIEPSLEIAKAHLDEAIDLMGQAARLLVDAD